VVAFGHIQDRRGTIRRKFLENVGALNVRKFLEKIRGIIRLEKRKQTDSGRIIQV